MVELKEQNRLATILEGTDVRGILAGHLHYSTTCTFAGIPVSVASATCYTQDLLANKGSMRGRDGAQAFNMVHVFRDRVLHTVVPVEESATVYEVSAEYLAEAISKLVPASNSSSPSAALAN